MKSTALIVLVALFAIAADDFGVNAIDVKSVQHQEMENHKPKSKKSAKKGAKSSKKDDKKSADKKDAKKAKKEETKKEASKEEAPEDDQTMAIEVLSGADEDEVIDNQFNKVAKEAMNAAGVSTGEKVVFKEDAIIAGKSIIKALKGLKGKKLNDYMKDHFEETWASYDVNGDGEISLEESHVFQRALMGRLNSYSLAQGSVSDINSTPLNSLIEDANNNKDSVAEAEQLVATEPESTE